MRAFSTFPTKKLLTFILCLTIGLSLTVSNVIRAEAAEKPNIETTAKTTGEISGETENPREGASEITEGPSISAPSAVLMEVSTGTVIYEKDADTPRPPASVTKVMTMLLIFDALEAGKINLTDEVTVSEFAASMGGSQVYLEPGETQTVETLLKCISIASANDACVSFKIVDLIFPPA